MPSQQAPRSPRIDVERNRANLLDAAVEAMTHDPDWSMADVARTANLTRATLYRHFGTREKLLEAMREDALARAGAAIEGSRLDEGSALEALRRAVEAVLAQGSRFRPLLEEGFEQNAAFLRRRQRVFAPLLDVVRRGQRAGQLRTDLPAEWVLSALMSLLTTAVRVSGAPWRGEHAEGATAEWVFTTLTEGVAKTP